MFTCPMCRKELERGTASCSRCRTDLTLLVDFMSNLEEHLNKADAALKAGELGDAVWAYLNVLETDPEHPVARKQVNKVATAVRQFDEARRTGLRGMFLLGTGAVAALLLVAGGVFYAGYRLGEWKAAVTSPVVHVRD